jgi:hypothetical protein
VSKGSGPVAKHSPPASAEGKSEWHYISTTIYAFYGVQRNKEVKRSGREVNHSPASISEVKNGWRYTSTPLDIFMA